MPNRIIVTMMGAEGVGKTTLLATMYKQLNRIDQLSEFKIIAHNDTGVDLESAYQTLEKTLNEEELHTRIPTPLPGTQGITECKFRCDFKDKKAFDFLFYDTPGGLLCAKDSHPELKKFKTKLKQSQVIINVIDGAAYIAGSHFMANRINSPTRVRDLLSTISDDGQFRLILFVITKSETWFDDKKEQEKLKQEFEKHHEEVLTLIKKSKKTIGMFMPVKTLGCYKFKWAENKGDEEKEDLIFKKIKSPFKPEAVEQPLCHATTFALHYYHENRSWLNHIVQGISGNKKAFEQSLETFNQKCKAYTVYQKT